MLVLALSLFQKEENWDIGEQDAQAPREWMAEQTEHRILGCVTQALYLILPLPHF